MKSKKRSLLCLSVLSVMCITGCNSSGGGWTDEGVVFTSEGETEYNKLSNLARGKTYTAYETYMPKSFNTATTMQQSDGQFIINFIEGLVTVNRYGRIIPNIASTWTTNADSSQYVFTIRDGVEWVTNNGQPYQVSGAQAYVTAQDFVKGIQENLNFANNSQSSYLPQMFIEGAAEYYTYTLYKAYQTYGYHLVTEASLAATEPSTSDTEAHETWTTCGANYVGRIMTPTSSTGCYPYGVNITDTDIEGFMQTDSEGIKEIASFSRVGVKASEDGKTLTYDLIGSMPYFLSALTYTPFLPIQSEFYDTVGAEHYGSSRTNVLANGPFILSDYNMGTSTSLTLTKNTHYWDKNNVKIGEIRILQVPDVFGDDAARLAFERGTIDGFSVNPQDEVGWNKYVKGGENGTGTRENPAHRDAFSVESYGDASSFDFALSIERGASGAAVSNSIFSKGVDEGTINPALRTITRTNAAGDNEEILNTNKAMKLIEVRKLILSSLDYPTYVRRYGNNDDVYSQTRYMINSYTPHHFYTVSGENENVKSADFLSYIEGAYIDEFLEGGRTEANWAIAEDIFEPSQFGGIGVADKPLAEQTTEDTAAYEEEYKQLYADAKTAIETYNSSHTSDPIQLPIYVEYTGLPEDDAINYDRAFINKTNSNINGCWVGGNNAEVAYARPQGAKVCSSSSTNGYGEQEIVRLIQNTKKNMTNYNGYQTITSNAATNLFVTGWGPDFSDPLTYANTVKTDGDLCDYYGLCTTRGSDPEYDAQITAVSGKYDALVEAAAAITNNEVARAEAFAKAEIELLFNMYVMRPLYMAGQGVGVSVSRTVPYRTTQANYGLCSYSYKHVEKLHRVILTAEQKAALKEEFETLQIADLEKGPFDK